MTLDNLKRLQKSTKDEINSKGRERAARTRRLLVAKRSKLFFSSLEAFLRNALSDFTTFIGNGSTIDPVTGAVSSDPEKTRALATDRISTTFFKQRIPPPDYSSDPSPAAWLKMPQQYHKLFKNLRDNDTNPALTDAMRPVTPSELDWALNKLGKNKSTGPSGLSAEMLLHASLVARTKHILPFVNFCIHSKNTPSSLKRFNVWCIVKVKGVGPIMHPTKKLDVRPTSLYEISYKPVETILAERISAVMNPKLHPAQHAFNSLRSVVDAITTYTLVMEEANQFHKRDPHLE
jgi:hypothetical protein